MRLKTFLGLALAGFTLAALCAGAPLVAEDDSDSTATQFKNAKIINTIAPPRRTTYGPGVRRRGERFLPQPVDANSVAPAEAAPPMASAPESPTLRPAGRRPVRTMPVNRRAAITNAPAAVIPPPAIKVAAPVINAPVANCPVPAVANTTADIANAASAEVKNLIEVSVKNNLASVKIVNSTMSDALNALAREGGFTVKLYGNFPEQPVSTEFVDMDLERAAIRIMGLAGMKNYFFHYDDKGNLNLLETFAAVGGIKPLPNTPVKRPVTTRVGRPQVTIPGADRQPARPTRVRPPISEEPSFSDQNDNGDDTDNNSDSEEPVYTPPTPRRR